MPSDKDILKAHPHAVNFLRGLVIALAVGGALLAVSMLFRGEEAETAARFQEVMNDAVTDLHAERYDKAAAGFLRARDLAVAAGRAATETAARTQAAQREADARYYLVVTRMRQLRLTYAKELARAVADPDDRFVPPEKDLEPIRAEIRAGIEAVPEHARLYHVLGYLESMAGNVHAAREALEKAVELDDRFAEAYNDLGVVYVKLRRFNKARECFERALLVTDRSRPPLPDAHYNLGLYYANLDRGTPSPAHRKKAVEHLEAFLEIEGAESPTGKLAKDYLRRLRP